MEVEDEIGMKMVEEKEAKVKKLKDEQRCEGNGERRMKSKVMKVSRERDGERQL